MGHWSLAFVALLLASPLVGANLVIRETSPSPYAIAFVPQMHCEIVWQTTSAETCRTEGQVPYVTDIQVRIVGTVVAHGFIDRATATQVREQVGQFHCTQTCSVPVAGGQTSGYLYLHVTAPTSGVRGSALSVALETDPLDLPIS